MIHLGKKTKIIATLGPASTNESVLKAMIKAGTDMIRLNASHEDDPAVIRSVVRLIRKCSRLVDKPVGIFLDLQGPKIRVGDFSD